MRLLKRYPTVAFFILAFVITWGIRIPMAIASVDATPLKLLAEYGPAIAAFIVTAAVHGRAGTRALLRRMLLWRVNPWWYILVLFGPAALQLACIGAFVLLGGPGVQFQFPGFATPFIFVIGLVLGLGEEIGWRGFAFAHLQARYHAVVASLIIGVLWAIWHIPGDLPTLLGNPSLLQTSSTYVAFAWFVGLTTTGSLLMAWVYNRTEGSILLMALFHMGLTVLFQFVALPQAVGQFGPNELSLILLAIFAVLLMAFTGATPAFVRARETPALRPSLSMVEGQESHQEDHP